MKSLLVFLMIFSSAQLFARATPDANSTWREITRSRRVVHQLPQYIMSHGTFSRAANVCVDGDYIRTKRSIKKCTQYTGREDRCVSWITVFPTKPIIGTTRRCVRRRNGDNDECIEWADIPYELSLTFDVKVYRRRSGGRNDSDYDRYSMYRPLFTKEFTISNCQ